VANRRNDRVIKDFGERLRTLRAAKNLSQHELATLAETVISQIARIERGESNPTLNTMSILATALDVPIEAFFIAEPALSGLSKP